LRQLLGIVAFWLLVLATVAAGSTFAVAAAAAAHFVLNLIKEKFWLLQLFQSNCGNFSLVCHGT